MRKFTTAVGTIGAAALVVSLGATGTAVARSLIDSGDIKNDSIASRDIHDGTIKPRDLSDQVEAGLQGPKGDKGDPGAGLVGQVSPPAVTITSIGGSFRTGATIVGGTLVLPKAGTYQINAYGFFDTVAADAERTDATHLQLAVRDQGAGEFGEDFGTCFTGAFPAGDREATCQSTRVIHVDAPTTLYVKAFGYNDDRSGTGSGSFTVTADVSAIALH
jgi:hypothetical protein